MHTFILYLNLSLVIWSYNKEYNACFEKMLTKNRPITPFYCVYEPILPIPIYESDFSIQKGLN